MAGIPAPNVRISTPRVFGLRGRFAICMPHMFTYNIATACFSFGGGGGCRHCGSHRSMWCPTCIESNGLVLMLGNKFLQHWPWQNTSLTHMYLPHVGCRFFNEVYTGSVLRNMGLLVNQVCLSHLFSQNVFAKCVAKHGYVSPHVDITIAITKYIHQIYGPGNGYSTAIFRHVFHKVYSPSVFRNMGLLVDQVCLSQLFSQNVFAKCVAKHGYVSLHVDLAIAITKCIHQIYDRGNGFDL